MQSSCGGWVWLRRREAAATPPGNHLDPYPPKDLSLSTYRPIPIHLSTVVFRPPGGVRRGDAPERRGDLARRLRAAAPAFTLAPGLSEAVQRDLGLRAGERVRRESGEGDKREAAGEQEDEYVANNM